MGKPGPVPRPHGRRRRKVSIPLLGVVSLPASDAGLAFYAGLVCVTLVGVVEWPVTLVLGLGHALVSVDHNKALEEFGEALDAAV